MMSALPFTFSPPLSPFTPSATGSPIIGPQIQSFEIATCFAYPANVRTPLYSLPGIFKLCGDKLYRSSGIASTASTNSFSTALISRSSTEATVGAGCCSCKAGCGAGAGRALAALVVPGLKPAAGKISTAKSPKIRVRFIAVILFNCVLVVFPIRGPFICKVRALSGHSGALPSAINRRVFAALSLSGLIASYAGDSYHSRAFSALSKAMITMPLGGSPSSDWVLPPRTT